VFYQTLCTIYILFTRAVDSKKTAADAYFFFSRFSSENSAQKRCKKLRWADQNLILFWDIILFFGKSYPRGRAACIARDRWQSDPLCAFFLARAVRSLPCPSQSRGRGRVRVHVHGGGRGRVQGGWCEEAVGPHRLTGRWINGDGGGGPQSC
jgi:hypothetical protein